MRPAGSVPILRILSNQSIDEFSMGLQKGLKCELPQLILQSDGPVVSGFFARFGRLAYQNKVRIRPGLGDSSRGLSPLVANDLHTLSATMSEQSRQIELGGCGGTALRSGA